MATTTTVPEQSDTGQPPQWATSLAQHRAGAKKLIRSLLEEEAGCPMWALDAMLAVVPPTERQFILADLRLADFGGGDDTEARVDAAVEFAFAAYDYYLRAAYAPPLSDDEVHDCHTAVTPEMLARAELHPLGDQARVLSVEEQADQFLALLHETPMVVVVANVTLRGAS